MNKFLSAIEKGSLITEKPTNLLEHKNQQIVMGTAYDLISEKLAELSKIDKIFRDRYKLDFVTFADKIKNDENYTLQLEKKDGFIEWDEDFISWEFNSNEINYWKKELQKI